MPEVFIARCKVCNSPHRAQIERWAKEDGLSFREIERRLADLGEVISNPAIGRHFREHFDVPSAVREQYQKSREVMQDTVKKRLSDLEILDDIIQGNSTLHQQTTAWLTDILKVQNESEGKKPAPRPPMTLVTLHEKTASESRQAIKIKLELLGEDPESKKADAVQSLVDMVMTASEDDG